MSSNYQFGYYGFRELADLFNEIEADFGTKDAKNILVNAARQAMKPVLETSKALVPVDTGLLRRGLWIESRKPRTKDFRSKYVNRNDAVIALVTTKPIPEKLKKEAYAKYGHLKSKSEFNLAKRKFLESKGHYWDARAVAMEWGTVNVTKRSYLRPALESQGSSVVNSLGSDLRVALDKYKVRQARKIIYGK